MNAILQMREFCEGYGCFCEAGALMSAHTSFRIGGPADLLVKPKDAGAAALMMQKAKELGLPLTLIGKGSDLLVSDSGLRGVVLSLDEEAAQPVLEGEQIIRCPAGASVCALCAFALRHGLTGLEFAWGIPGSVGGAVYMNAGAYGGEMSNVLLSASSIDADGAMHTLTADALELRYRHSWFTDHSGQLITEACFRLEKGDPAVIHARMEELMTARKTKQPLEYPSAGSTFKRPNGGYASALIDQCGLKGRRVGGAMVSKKHAGFLINYDGATCEDVRELIRVVQREVLEKTGFSLECEIKLIGEN